MELGKRQSLIIVKTVEFGVYLSTQMDNQQDKVLLPKKQVPDNAEVGDSLDVFIYRDSKDRLIATTKQPKISLGEVGLLKVIQNGQVGAFLDWGLEKDLLLPFREQTKSVSVEEEVLVALYVDKSNRLCATMNVYPYLFKNAPYKNDDRVTGRVYEISREFGAFVAVDDKYSALIPVKEMYGKISIGDMIKARVTGVKEDGKLDLSIREKAYLQISTDAKKIMEALNESGGRLAFNDKASPELIREKMNMSKNEFKRAVGHLLKEKQIEIGENEISLVK